MMLLVSVLSFPSCAKHWHDDQYDDDAYCAFALTSLALGILWKVSVKWYFEIVLAAVVRQEAVVQLRRRMAAPSGTIEEMRVLPFEVESFGEDKRYYAECPICLVTFGPDEAIRLTPCDHPFHEECLGSWLQVGRTCAVCRCDVTEGLPRTVSRSPQDQEEDEMWRRVLRV